MTAKVSLIPRPANDRIENRTQITGTNILLVTSADAASPDPILPFEPRSLWWEWTAPGPGLVTVDCDLSTPNSSTRLEVFLSTAGGGLVYASKSVVVSAGSKLLFMINGGNDSGTNKVVLRVRMPGFIQKAGNDLFANRFVLSGASIRTNGILDYADRETYEPSHNSESDYQTVWYSWQPPERGTVRLQAASATTPRLAVYRGESLTSLLAVGISSAGGPLTLVVTPTNSLELAIADVEGASFDLALDFTPSPGNDDFLNATPLAFGYPAITFNTDGAALQTGEPNHGGTNGLRHTVWYSWTANQSGPVVFLASSTNSDPVLGVYQGTNVTALSLVASNGNFSPVSSDARVGFDAIAGET